MLNIPQQVALPLKTDETGSIRVSGTRVSLENLLHYYQQGESPEVLHQSFPTIPLADIYAVIAYYLAHQGEVDAYLVWQDTKAERNRQAAEAAYTPSQKARTTHFRHLVNSKKTAF